MKAVGVEGGVGVGEVVAIAHALLNLVTYYSLEKGGREARAPVLIKGIDWEVEVEVELEDTGVEVGPEAGAGVDILDTKADLQIVNASLALSLLIGTTKWS